MLKRISDVFARGFKTWCENVALQQRRQLGLQSTDPLSPSRLAEHLGIAVWTPETVPGLDASARKVLLHDDPSSWSAVTLSVGTKDVIIMNSAHSGGRPASNLMHELAHILIGHKPGRVDVSEDGLLVLHTYDREQEAEANWLSGCLLLPRAALLWVVRQRLDEDKVRRRYGVSSDMLEWRFRMTGVFTQVQRTRSPSRR